MIVGRKIETFLTVTENRSGFVVTKHGVVKDLHPTRGWRTIARSTERQIRDSRPNGREVKANTATVYEARRQH